MHGNLVGPRGLLVGLMFTVAACAHNVSQEAASGADGKQKGAKSLTFENGEAHANGIVTYPGGDRIDWKLIELPDKQRGQLDLKLAWTTPRPGLQLAFDVFDEWNQPIVQSQKSSKRARGRSRSATVNDAHGKYFVRVFAVNRGDAGKYRLTASFSEKVAGPGFDPSKIEIPDPPKLAAVPEVEIGCDEFTFDIKVPSCKTVCGPGAPPNWPGCAGKCPTPPDPNNPACQKSMDCPSPPDRKFAKCAGKFPKCPDPKHPDPNNPNCDNIKLPPVIGRIVGNSVSGSELIITIGQGQNAGVEKSWSAVVLRGDSEEPLRGGDVTIVRVDKTLTVGKVRLTTDQLSSNSRVRLSAP